MRKTAVIIITLSITAIITSCDPPRFMTMKTSKAEVNNMEVQSFHILEETEDKTVYLTNLERLVQKIGDEKSSYAGGDELFLRYETRSILKNTENQSIKISAILHCMPERIITREKVNYDTYAFEILHLVKAFYKNGEVDGHAKLSKKWVSAGLASDNGLPSKIVDYYFNHRKEVPVQQENLIGLEQNRLRNGVYEFVHASDSIERFTEFGGQKILASKIIGESTARRILIVKNDTILYKIANSNNLPAAHQGRFGDYYLHPERISNGFYSAKNVDIQLFITVMDDNIIEIEVIEGYITYIYSGGQYFKRKEILPAEKQTLSFVRELTAEDEKQLSDAKLK